MSLGNSALNDEVEALNSIYGNEAIAIPRTSAEASDVVLKPPNSPFSFLLSIPKTYPDTSPNVLSIQSTGGSGKGEGEEAVRIVRDVLHRVWTPGQVCLFDLIEEAGPILRELLHDGLAHGDSADTSASAAAGAAHGSTMHTGALTLMAAPLWIISEPQTVNKSTFIAWACRVSTLSEATDAIAHLISTNKKIASATHNISAWRIQMTNPQKGRQTTIQDCDDDGETAAGGRLLHLMQLMDVWNVVIVVTRWYGGVKLGPDRFRLINNVAREVLLKGAFAKNELEKGKSRSKGAK